MLLCICEGHHHTVFRSAYNEIVRIARLSLNLHSKSFKCRPCILLVTQDESFWYDMCFNDIRYFGANQFPIGECKKNKHAHRYPRLPSWNPRRLRRKEYTRPQRQQHKRTKGYSRNNISCSASEIIFACIELYGHDLGRR